MRLRKAVEFIEEKFSQELLRDESVITQGGIIIVMKMKLK